MMGEILALASAVCIGFSNVFVKNVTPRFSTLYLTALRLTISSLVAITIAFIFSDLSVLAQMEIRILGVLLAAGIIVGIGHVSLVKAISLDDVSRVAPATTGLYILACILISVLATGNKVSWWTICGGLMVLGGVYLLSKNDDSTFGSKNFLSLKLKFYSLLFASITGLCWAIGAVFMDIVVEHLAPIPATAFRLLFMTLIITSILVYKRNIVVKGLSKRDLLVVFVSGLFLGASTLTFIGALKLSTPAIVVVLNCTSPFFVVPLAVIWLKEKITKQVILGMFTCFLGVLMTLI
jgi:drug/metabolite transporter (DMT)-like permease